MSSSIQLCKSFFAAANGYDGFRSYFKKVFCPEKYAKIFIIKGGPGTGKSTLMRKVSLAFHSKCNITYIQCSSDPNSLDGVILENNNVKVAIIDGTAPHITDPIFPGAIEEIINIGDGFNYVGLENERNAIFDLVIRKNSEYKKAYGILKEAGNIHRYIEEYLVDNKVYNEAETLVDNLIKDEMSVDKEAKKSCVLLKAFSKDGFVTSSQKLNKKNVFAISGDGISEYVLSKILTKKLSSKKSICRIYPSPLSDELIDAVETDDSIYYVLSNNKKDVRPLNLIIDSDEYRDFNMIYNSLMIKSMECLKKASTLHSQLEGIYSHNISFSENDKVKDILIDRIEEIFNK